METPLNTTPMLKQYQDIKQQHPDTILFFRLGDFYEMFYEDAKVASNLLNLVLTSRSNGKSAKVPMCGVPYHSADNYIAKLIKAGQKVAICEQVEDPALAKGLVKRDVIRTITSGTFLDDNSSEARYLLSIFYQDQTFGFSVIDSTSGTIYTNEYKKCERLIETLSKLSIYECIFDQSQEERIKQILDYPLLRLKNIVRSRCEDWYFNLEMSYTSLCSHFKIHNLSGFGIEEMTVAQQSCGALLEYLKQMNKQPLKHIDKISLYNDAESVFISPAAHYGLELENLIKTLDKTLTPLGKRSLRQWVYHPLRDINAIQLRQQAVQLLKESSTIRQEIEHHFRHLPDIEKSISRLSCGYTHHKDILAIRNTLVKIPEIIKLLSDVSKQNDLLKIIDIPQLRTLLETAINPDIPLTHSEGKIIRPGFNAELDSLREIAEHGQNWLKNFQMQEIKRTGINSLKVGFNQVFGYYIEITHANRELVPTDYIRKQTLVNGERYITDELKSFEEKALTAQEKILKIEQHILLDLQQTILDHSFILHELAESLSVIDTLYALSFVAIAPNTICPTINDTNSIDIKNGRHPVVEQRLNQSFIPNDTYLNCHDNHLLILTGPNMAGKSTYISQIALLVIMAQMGSFIPASAATIGIVDKIFTRIGAHDDISKGQSTFMVEMNETADILNNLSSRSLVILDEIGRGTSTYDGLSLAWALAEHLQQQRVRTLFATHFHELTILADQLSGVKNYNVAVKEWKDEIIFLHKIVEGSTDDSYGIYVAKLAGIPTSIIHRSRQILKELEERSHFKETLQPQFKMTQKEDQLNFLTSNTFTEDPVAAEIKSSLENLNINTLTPLAALNKLQELKNLVNTMSLK